MPFGARWRNHHPYTIFTGANFGAFHALSMGLRLLEQVNRVFGMSGQTDVEGFLGGYHNETVTRRTR